MPCPIGRYALANESAFANDLYYARPPRVSGPKIDEMIAMMQSGRWNWTGREIKRNGNIIIDGHQRYIAARLAGIEPVFVERYEPVRLKFRWGEIAVEPDRWDGGY